MNKLIFIFLICYCSLNGHQWTRIDFDFNSRILLIKFNQSNGIYVSTQNHGIFYSPDSGTSWHSVDSTSNYYIHDMAFNSNGQSFLCSWDKLIIATNSRIDTIISGIGSVSEIVVDPNDKLIINNNAGGIIYSTDNGLTWSPDTTFNFHQTFLLNSNYKDNLYIGVMHNMGHIFGSGLFQSQDYGATWEYLFFYGNSFIRSAIGRSKAYAVIGGNKLYYSEDIKNSWDLVNQFNRPEEIIKLVIDEHDNLYAIFSNTIGLFIFNNTDSIWVKVNTNAISDSNITDIAFDLDNVTYVGTSDGQLFKDTSSTTYINKFKKIKVASLYTLNENYPNPFNSSTTIRYTISKPENVTFEVFNLLGQKIITLIDKQMPSGSHKVEFTAENLPSGVYLYRIKTGKYQETKKMILLR